MTACAFGCFTNTTSTSRRLRIIYLSFDGFRGKSGISILIFPNDFMQSRIILAGNAMFFAYDADGIPKCLECLLFRIDHRRRRRQRQFVGCHYFLMIHRILLPRPSNHSTTTATTTKTKTKTMMRGSTTINIYCSPLKLIRPPSKAGENYKVKMAKLQSELQNKPLQGSCT